MNVLHFKPQDAVLSSFAEGPGTATLGRLVDTDISSSMGAGIAEFDECSVEWTVTYDEVIVVLEGEFRLRLADRVIVAGPGEIIWIPENTPLHYEGTKAKVFFAVYPGDWASRSKLVTENKA